ncbi:MAG: HEAT repeat domain-containing protein [Spirochaetes bacterium]|nr:HEAT repeat domain-containing protein [Spirochaetota bacterium]
MKRLFSLICLLMLSLSVLAYSQDKTEQTNIDINAEVEKYFKKLKGSSIPYLIDVVIKGAKPVKVAAIRSLGNLKAQKAKDLLVAVMCYVWNPDLYEKNFSKGYENVIPAFDHDVRASAAIALADIRDDQTLDLVGNTLLADRNPKVRKYAALALGKFKKRDGIQYLEKAISYELTLDKFKISDEVILACVQALGMIGNKDGFFALIEVTQSKKLQYSTKKEALNSLEKIKWE